ncbi:MAG: carboxymuconolactone decarboxylase family protein [Syntrophales bacterium]|nr:carboxymuconolactone decarboxylase family protein [Syntrophales bacterium]MDD5640053.1 carboxymuconolactone decarboxylase family protein [Syntrophales bacterium]
MARLPDPRPSFSPEAQEIYDRLAAKRGRIDGMYLSLLNDPELTHQVGALGTYLRFEGALPDDMRELTILWLARRLKAAYEWVKHVPYARKAGIPEEVLEAIRTGREPAGLRSDLQLALQVADCVLEKRSLPAPLQDSLAAAVGLAGVVELVVLCGFYEMIAGVIFAFDVPLPEGEGEPF